MEGYRLPIRQFTLRFNEVYGTNFHFTTMQKYSKLMYSVIKTSHVKPRLKDMQKLRRLDFVLNRLEPVGNGLYRIWDMRNEIHVDGKWFYVMRTQCKSRVFPKDPRHLDQETLHKSHIEKLLFLAAVGVPQFAPDGTWFDGEVGIWLIAERTEAQRASVNRPVGAKMIKALTMTSDEYLHTMTRPNGVLDAIRQKLYWLAESGVIIHHDSASSYEGRDNDFHLACAGWEHGFKIDSVRQPAQSPDCNKLDLCLIYSMDSQAQLIKGNATNKEALVDAVMQQQ
jgi:hypothetical protein